MQAIQGFSPIVRAIGVIGAVAVLVTSVTFAALNDTATLTDNTLNSATADLNVWNGSAWNGTATGFTVGNIIPGTGSSPQAFYLQNASPFNMDVTVKVVNAPALPAGIDSWDDVLVEFRDENGDPIGIETNFTVLTTTSVSLGVMPANTSGDSNAAVDGNFSVVFDFDPTGVTGQSVSVPNFDFEFTGTQVVGS